ncbi:PspC domain-containing protein [Legionella brunensis]|uniref:Phage shock protein C, PspC n=1 Tax=Legionella brunensis TaxID=29422 RepID=A0A0W0SD83_9GAMM|nr:PspC domain-containing protein [Legionella brunensis]KTC81360.1 phage shock protein C, PspC [Legionella brunensis]
MKQLTPAPKRLYRSRRERMIAGVCGGLAEYFGMDPTIMRLIFVVLLLLGGSTILVYLIMWLVVPQEP